MSLNGLRIGGQCPSKPLSKGETLLINTLVSVLLALAFGVIGFIGWPIVRAFI